MFRWLLSLILLLLPTYSAEARQELTVGNVAPGMTKADVLKSAGEPVARTDYDPHAYIVYSHQPLFPNEQTWFYKGPQGESRLLFQGERLRSIRAQTLKWRGQSYSPEAWPAIEARVTAASPTLIVGYQKAPKNRGFYLSNLQVSEQQARQKRYDLVVGLHHFDSQGDIYRCKPGQICQTCLRIRQKQAAPR